MVLLGAGACSRSDSKTPEVPAYGTIVDEKPLESSAEGQMVTLARAGAPMSATVVLKIPPGAVPAGVKATVRLVSGVPMKSGAPVADTAIEVLPVGLQLQTPARARMRVPTPAPARRYVAVRAPSAADGRFVQKGAGRRVELAASDLPDTEAWEFDIEGAGVWGLAEHPEAVTKQTPGGAVVTDETEIPFVEEEQQIIMGPPQRRVLLVVPPMAPRQPAALRGPTPAGAQLVFQTTPQPGRGSVIVQTVRDAPRRGGSQPLNETVIRVRPGVPVAPTTIEPRPPMRLLQPAPRAVSTLTAVRSEEAGTDWQVSGPVGLAAVAIPEAASGSETAEITIDPNADAYHGLALKPGAGVPALTAEPDAIDFGITLAGATTSRTLTITNAGTARTAALTIVINGNDGGAFMVQSAPEDCAGRMLDPQVSCSVAIALSTSMLGMKNASVSITDGSASVTATLSGSVTSPVALQAAPLALNFGALPVGTASTAQEITLRNQGGQPSGLPVVAIAGMHPNDFALSNGCQQAIEAAGSCKLTITFTPGAPGDRSASLSVTTDPGASLQVPLTGRGQSPGELRIAPTAHGFGPTIVGQSSAVQVFSVSNPGQVATGVPMVGLAGVDAAQFTIENNGCTAAVAPGGKCEISVAFTPSAAGARTASLQVQANPGGSTNAALSGTAQAPAALTATPTPVAFGGIPIGLASMATAIVVSNPGDLATGTLSTALTGANPDDFLLTMDGCEGQAIADGADCTILIQFKPAAVGVRQATLNLTAAPGGSLAISLSGTGLAPASFTMTPSSRAFGALILGQTSAETSFSITNNGQQTSGALMVALAGSNPTQFEITTDACTGKALASQESCMVAARFAPTAAGAAAAALDVSASPGGLGTAALSGTGQRPAVLSAMQPMSFGSVVLNTQSDAITVTFTNTGDQQTSTPAVMLSGATDFAIAGNACTGAILGGGSCTVQVVFTPQAAGQRTAKLTMTAATGGSAAVDLAGVGLLPAALSRQPATVAFGGRVVGNVSAPSLVTITNGGGVRTGAMSIAVTGAHASDFSTTHDCTALDPQASCSVSVTFAPGATGNRTAKLDIAASPGGSISVDLSGSGLKAAELSITPGSDNFGSLTVGSTSAATRFTVKNEGEVDTGTLTVTKNGGAFQLVGNSCSSVVLNPAATCFIDVAFAPSTAGAATGSLQVGATPGGSLLANLSGTGISPAMLTGNGAMFFRDVIVNDSHSITMTVENTGGSSAGSWSAAITGADALSFKIDPAAANSCNFAQPLAGGASCDVKVDYTPTTVEFHDATLTISSASGGNVVTALFGVGNSTSTWFTVAPPSYEYSVGLGAWVSNTFQVWSKGPAATLSAAIVGGDADKFELFGSYSCPNGLPANSLCDYYVRCLGSALGAYESKLRITVTNDNSYFDVPLRCTVSPATGDCSPRCLP